MTNAEKAQRLHAIASQLELVAYELELSVLSPERERELAAKLTTALDDLWRVRYDDVDPLERAEPS